MILVVGTGRSGTSVVARILHEDLGVSMGSNFDPPHPTWPDGNYEDRVFRALHIQANQGRITRSTFRARLQELARGRGEPWGVKDPRASHLVEEYCAVLPSVRIIWCVRAVEAVVDSIVDAWGIRRSRARLETITRYAALQQALAERPHLALDMTRRWPQTELRQALCEWLENGDILLEKSSGSLLGPSTGGRAPRRSVSS